MRDIRALPADHVLKPLELRMMEMVAGMPSPLRITGGNFVAALRVFATKHPGLHDSTGMCASCGLPFDTTFGVWTADPPVCITCGEEAG